MTTEDTQPARAELLPIELLASPFVRFAKLEAAGGILLLVSTIVALVWANSPWAQTYHELWSTHASIGFGRFFLSETRLEWINDGLMSIFFFLVGLEIKREVLIGELSSLRHSISSLAAPSIRFHLPFTRYKLESSRLMTLIAVMDKVPRGMQGALEPHWATERLRDSSRRVRSGFFTRILGISAKAKEVPGLDSDIPYLVDL